MTKVIACQTCMCDSQWRLHINCTFLDRCLQGCNTCDGYTWQWVNLMVHGVRLCTSNLSTPFSGSLSSASAQRVQADCAAHTVSRGSLIQEIDVPTMGETTISEITQTNNRFLMGKYIK